jgi:hypothetical protein
VVEGEKGEVGSENGYNVPLWIGCRTTAFRAHEPRQAWVAGMNVPTGLSSHNEGGLVWLP